MGHMGRCHLSEVHRGRQRHFGARGEKQGGMAVCERLNSNKLHTSDGMVLRTSFDICCFTNGLEKFVHFQKSQRGGPYYDFFWSVHFSTLWDVMLRTEKLFCVFSAFLCGKEINSTEGETHCLLVLGISTFAQHSLCCESFLA